MKKVLLLSLCIGLVTAVQTFAQEKTVQGTVVDGTTKEPLPGVTILIKGTAKGSITDQNGKFSVTVTDPNAVLQFSFISYTTQDVAVGTQNTIDVSLNPELKTIDEVVVIGYGAVKKKDATGVVNTVSSSDFNKGIIASPENLIAGKTAGVVVTSNSGAPGVASTIRIRGGASIMASNDPLIVIDGVPVDNNRMNGSPGGLSTINPNDIESFTILKDASATAIYGSRASGGVILITTKRGSAKFKVTYNASLSLTALPKKVEVLSGDEFRTLFQQQYPDDAEGRALMTNENTDWQNEIYSSAFSQDHNLSIAGMIGNANKLPYRASLGYTNQDGILKTTDFERTTLGIGVDPKLFKDHLNISLNIKGMYNKNNFSDQSAITDAVNYDPTKPVYNETGYWRGYTTWTHSDGTGINLATPNPIAKIDLTDNTSIVKRAIGNAQFDYKFHFLPDLRANLNLAYDYADSKGHNNLADSTQWVYLPTSGCGRHEEYSEKRKNSLLDFYLDYNKQLDAIRSHVDLMAGYSYSYFWKENIDTARTADNSVTTYSRDLPTDYVLISFFGRLNYTLMDRYLLTFTLRNDQTSRFSSKNRSGLFPSAALAWRLSEERFMKNISAISDLKIRLGYGVTGQQDLLQGTNNINDYPYIPTFTMGTSEAMYRLGSIYYFTERPDGYNSTLKWETTTTKNIGLDYGLFKNRVTGSFDYYVKETEDLLLLAYPPVLSNFTNSLLSNVGTMENKGIEFAINAKLLSRKNLLWEVGYNIGYNKNKITSLTLVSNDTAYLDNQNIIIQGTIGDFIQVNKVGYAANSYYVYQQVYDEAGKPIEGSYVDRNNDGVVNTGDMYVHKNPTPAIVMGISSNFNYKNWDFSFAGRINLGNYVYNNIAASSTYSKMHSTLGFLSNTTQYVNEAQFTNTQYHSDYYIQDGSFFKMDNINLGYRFTKLMNGKVNLHTSLSVLNAFMITKYKGIDPEITNGMDNNFFPRSRVFMFTLNLEI
jgi:TonB-dependent starch-binding outer membrane protein SusC